MKELKSITAIVLLGAAVALAVFIFSRTEVAIRRVTIEILRSIPRMFLVLETEKQISVATVDDGGWLLGPRSGQATATTRSHWGVDFQQVESKDVDVSGSDVRVRMPDPTLLDRALDYSTLRLITKRSGFQFARDLARGRSLERELLEMLSSTPPEYTPDDIRARRMTFIDRLNRQAAALFHAKRLDVEFY